MSAPAKCLRCGTGNLAGGMNGYCAVCKYTCVHCGLPKRSLGRWVEIDIPCQCGETQTLSGMSLP